eukprot:3408644-Prymnesium_polylepis.1
MPLMPAQAHRPSTSRTRESEALRRSEATAMAADGSWEHEALKRAMSRWTSESERQGVVDTAAAIAGDRYDSGERECAS